MPPLPHDSKQKTNPSNELQGISHAPSYYCSLTPPIIFPQSYPGAWFSDPRPIKPIRQSPFKDKVLRWSTNLGNSENDDSHGGGRLRNSLATLKRASCLLPDLSVSIDILLSCHPQVEILLRKNPGFRSIDLRWQEHDDYTRRYGGSEPNHHTSHDNPEVYQLREDYAYLTSELPTLSESLSKLLGYHWDRPLLSDAAMSVIMSIVHEAHAVNAAVGPFLDPLRDQSTPIMCKEMIQHYRRIGALFQMLQRNLNIGKQNNTSEGLPQVVIDRLGSSTLPCHYSIQRIIHPDQQTRALATHTREFFKLNEWLNDPQSHWILWFTGFIESGATTIVYTFCEEMQKQKLLAASFFCTRTNECCDVDRIIPAIAHQISQYSFPFLLALLDIFKNNPEAGSGGLRQQFEQLLRDPLQKARVAMPDLLVIVINALDECDNRRGVELILDLLVQYTPDIKLKFLITSRPMTDVHTKITTSHRWRHSVDFLNLDNIDKSLVQKDMKDCLTKELQHLHPSEIDINRLVKHFGISFLYTAKLVSYVRSSKELFNQQERLRSLIDMTSISQHRHSFLDSTYLDVLNDVAGDIQPKADGAKEIQMFLQAILLAYQPINVQVIGMLAGIFNQRRIKEILLRLQSVLGYSGLGDPVPIRHSAFSQFIFSEERAGPYFCSATKHSQVLAQRCFFEMKKNLRFNICKLEFSYLLDEEVKDIYSRIRNNISPSLVYACHCWAYHLVLAADINSTLKFLGEFLSCQLLFWIEVLNLRGELNSGVSALLETKNALERANLSLELTSLLNEAYIFVRDLAASPISRSTPHIYISSLQLCPSSSIVYQMYSRQVCRWLKSPDATRYRDVLHPTPQSSRIVSGVLSATYSPDGSRVAIGCEDGTVRIFDAHTGLMLNRPFTRHSDWVRCVVFSPDGAYILSASSDCTIQKWDSVSGAPLAASFHGHTHPVKSIAFSPDGTRVVSGSWDNTVRIWNAQDGKSVSEPLEGHKWGVNCVAFSPNNASIASGANDHTIRLWEPRNNIHYARLLEGHTNGVTSIVFTPGGSRLVSGSVDCSICVWDTKDGTLTTRFLQSCVHMIYSVAISPDGRLVASGSSDSTVKVWDIDTGNAVFGPMGHASGVRTVTFSPDGTRLFSGSHESARSWNLRPGLEAPNFNSLPESQHVGIPSTTQVLDRVGGSSGVSEGSITGLSALRPEKRAPRPPLSITSLRWLLERSQLAYIPKDAITSIYTVSTLEPNCFLMSLPEGWERKSEGWLVNHRSRLLVWLPESYGSCQLHSDADRQSRLIFWWLRYQELVGDQWPGGSGRLTKTTDKSSSKRWGT